MEEELLARLGAKTCVFCGKLMSEFRTRRYVYLIERELAGEPCTKECLKAIREANKKAYKEYEECDRRQAKADLEAYKALLQSPTG